MDPLALSTIGGTSVKVTRLGLGGAALSGMSLANRIYGGVDKVEAEYAIDAAYTLGIRYFDTAPLYGEGRSEVRMGAVLSERPRDSFTISTKVGRVLECSGNGGYAHNSDGLPSLSPFFDMSRDGMFRSLEESLKRLKLESVDILFLHDPDVEDLETDAIKFALPALMEMREKGIVKAVGVGMNQWEMPCRFIKSFDLDAVLLAGRYTLLEQSALSEFMPECLARRVSIIVGGPYNSGLLARNLSLPTSYDYAPTPSHMLRHATHLSSVCGRYKVPLHAAALQFVLAHPAVVSVIPGAQSVNEMRDNVKMLRMNIPADLWCELKSEGLLPKDAPTPADFVKPSPEK